MNLNKIGFVILVLLTFSLTISKSAIHLLFFLLLLFAFYVFFQSNIEQKNDYLKKWKIHKALAPLLACYFLGIILNLFSLGGLNSSLEFAKTQVFPLFFLPLILFIHSNIQIKQLISTWALAIVYGALLSLIGFILLFKGSASTSEARLGSFFDVGRWSVILSVTLTFFSILFFEKEFSYLKNKVLHFLFILISFASFLISQSRGPWLSCFLAMSLYFLIYIRKFFLYFLISVITIVGFMTLNPAFYSRMKSISNFKYSENGTLSSPDVSIDGRFNMWKVGLDFYKEQPVFGVGFNNTKPPLEVFLSSQSHEYRTRHVVQEFNLSDHHNSYLHILNQMGGIYFCVYFLSLFNLLFHVFKLGSSSFIARASSLSAIGYLFLMIFYTDLVSYTAYLFYLILFLGYWHGIKRSEQNPLKEINTQL